MAMKLTLSLPAVLEAEERRARYLSLVVVAAEDVGFIMILILQFPVSK
jgi:hypothetical protein